VSTGSGHGSTPAKPEIGSSFQLLPLSKEGLNLETRQILLNLLDFDQHFVLARSALRGRIQLEQQRIIRTEVCPSIGGRGRARESRKNLSRPTRGERR
jgi:hypothetical protein